MHTAIAMRIHSLPVDFTELSHPAVDNKKTMCYITNRTKEEGNKRESLRSESSRTQHFCKSKVLTYMDSKKGEMTYDDA